MSTRQNIYRAYRYPRAKVAHWELYDSLAQRRVAHGDYSLCKFKLNEIAKGLQKNYSIKPFSN